MTELSTVEARERFAEVVNRAAFGRERVVLTRHGKPLAAIVSIEDLEWLRELEDRFDRDEASAALEESRRAGETVPLERLRSDPEPSPPILPLDKIGAICRRFEVKELSIFGSALRNDFRPDSDLDFLVEFEPNAEIGLIELGRMENELSDLVGRDVDLVPKSGLRPFLRDEVLATARVLYAA